MYHVPIIQNAEAGGCLPQHAQPPCTPMYLLMFMDGPRDGKRFSGAIFASWLPDASHCHCTLYSKYSNASSTTCVTGCLGFLVACATAWPHGTMHPAGYYWCGIVVITRTSCTRLCAAAFWVCAAVVQRFFSCPSSTDSCVYLCTAAHAALGLWPCGLAVFRAKVATRSGAPCERAGAMAAAGDGICHPLPVHGSPIGIWPNRGLRALGAGAGVGGAACLQGPLW